MIGIGSILPIFLMMLGAAFLGFLLSWLLAKGQNNGLANDQVAQLMAQNSQLQGDYERVLEYSNGFHKEKKDLMNGNEALEQQIKGLKAEIAQLQSDKSLLIQEYNKFDLEESQPAEGGRSTDNEEELQALRVQLNDLNQELFTWKNKHKILSENITKTTDDLQAKTNKKSKNSKPEKSGKSKKWESKYKALKLKFLELTHEKNLFEDQMEKLKTANDKLLTEVMEFKSHLPEPNLIGDTIMPKKKSKNKEKDIFHKIKKRAALIDFKRIGKASEKKKDDLKQIHGVGPFIEKKLNALGIYKFEQIARLEDDDLMEIIRIIELPTGVVKGRNWIDQAKNMKE